ncbi:hypothetical protein HK096_006464 [Nowakowskiella sp. JEL0078]|nr:hypothetical protein HK096_006464 [Nowakowskiella sp. JEL0078]
MANSRKLTRRSLPTAGFSLFRLDKRHTSTAASTSLLSSRKLLLQAQNSAIHHIHSKLDSLNITPLYRSTFNDHPCDHGRIYLTNTTHETDTILKTIRTHHTPKLSNVDWSVLPNHIQHVVGFDTETTPSFIRHYEEKELQSAPSTIQFAFGVPYCLAEECEDWAGQLVVVVRVFNMLKRERDRCVSGEVTQIMGNPKFVKVGLQASGDAAGLTKYYKIQVLFK